MFRFLILGMLLVTSYAHAYDYKKDDADLNSAYKDLKECANNSDFKEIRKAQRLWVKYREAACDIGSLTGSQINECLTLVTSARTEELNHFSSVLCDNSESASIDISGWWALNGDINNCNDTDSQYRVALGKWRNKDGNIQFGKGNDKIGMYEYSCDLSAKKVDNNIDHTHIEYKAKCMSENGESKGRLQIFVDTQDKIHILLPYSREGFDLLRCDSKY